MMERLKPDPTAGAAQAAHYDPGDETRTTTGQQKQCSALAEP